MDQRTLGTLRVSPMGLGCMGMSASYGATDETESLATIDRALALGCSFLDTAEMYGPFTNETLVGKAIAGRRGLFTVATKFGIRFLPTAENPTNRVLDGTPENVRRSIEGSLGRLGTDHVDLYYPGCPRPRPTRSGARTPFIRSRPCRASCPCGRATWRPRSCRRHGPRFSGDNLDQNLGLTAKVEALVAEKGVTPGQLALAWVLARGPDVVPIPGTKRRTYLEENLGALDVRLSAEELARIEAEVPKAAGDRYDRTGMATVDG